MKLIINGVNGRLGCAIAEMARLNIAAGVDVNAEKRNDFPVYGKLSDISEKADVIIDCSFYGAVYDLLGYAESVSAPVVIATTGHTREEKDFIADAAKRLPVFMSANMSLGISLLAEVSKRAAKFLESSFDIEILEAHHNRKTDAPSGTALLLANAINGELSERRGFVYDRSSSQCARSKAEIGIHSIRGGSIVGEHEVIFAGTNEILKFSHSTLSRNVFAEGALAAAAFMQNKPAGLYNMENMLGSLFTGEEANG